MACLSNDASAMPDAEASLKTWRPDRRGYMKSHVEHGMLNIEPGTINQVCL